MRNTSIAPIAVVPPGKTIYVQIIYFYIIYVRERFTTGRGKIKEKKNVKKKKEKRTAKFLGYFLRHLRWKPCGRFIRRDASPRVASHTTVLRKGFAFALKTCNRWIIVFFTYENIMRSDFVRTMESFFLSFFFPLYCRAGRNVFATCVVRVYPTARARFQSRFYVHGVAYVIILYIMDKRKLIE